MPLAFTEVSGPGPRPGRAAVPADATSTSGILEPDHPSHRDWQRLGASPGSVVAPFGLWTQHG